jgi:hypothetical protein
MCLILFNQPELDCNKVKNIRELIDKNLFDFDEFKPLIDMALSDRLKGLKDYCKKANINYVNKLKEMCKIIEIEHGFYLIIVPFFISRNIIIEQDELFKKWCELLDKLKSN